MVPHDTHSKSFGNFPMVPMSMAQFNAYYSKITASTLLYGVKQQQESIQCPILHGFSGPTRCTSYKMMFWKFYHGTDGRGTI